MCIIEFENINPNHVKILTHYMQVVYRSDNKQTVNVKLLKAAFKTEDYDMPAFFLTENLRTRKFEMKR